MINIRRVFLLLAISAFVILLLFMSYSTDNFSIPRPPNIKRTYHKNASVIDTPGCRIPFWQPFDPSVVKFYKKIAELINCGGKPSFLRALPNGTIFVNNNILNNYYHFTIEDVKCEYRPIFRNPGTSKKPTDNKYRLGETLKLEFNKSIEHEFLLATCYGKKDKKLLEEFVSIFPSLKQDDDTNNNTSNNNSSIKSNNTTSHPTDSPIPAPAPNEPLNIIIIGIDSISKLNFIRHFPKTRSFLKSLDAIELHGYTKVGDNTFPNITPFLTGHFVEYYWNETVRNTFFFDDLDFVWKEYAKRGYKTLLAEDAPSIATFNYLKLGFKKPPTDYYYRPMALAMEDSKLKKESKTHCFGSKMEMEILFDHLRKFINSEARPSLTFSFTFVARLTHDVLNNAGYADQPSVTILEDIEKSGMFNNSVLVFFSDHGIRFGDIRKTYIGKFEERMPMAFLVFPPWFYSKYPLIYKNLKENEKRLTTPFDIHATLLQLLDISSTPPTNITFNDYGFSLFGEISPTRTCKDAGILPHWCTCQIHTPIDTKLKTVTSAAHALLDTINDWLLRLPDCVNLTLSNILDARIGTPSAEVLSYSHHINDVINRHPVFGDKIKAPVDYLLTITAQPGGGVFEGTVRYYSEFDTYKVLDDISRVNMYGNQSYCIQDSHLRKYCYCKGFVTLL